MEIIVGARRGPTLDCSKAMLLMGTLRRLERGGTLYASGWDSALLSNMAGDSHFLPFCAPDE